MQLEGAKRSLKSVLPGGAWSTARDAVYWIRRTKNKFERRPPVGWVRFGSFRRVLPIDPTYGFRWGQVIDRYYIENFLARYAADIHGNVLEVATDFYTQRFGGNRVSRSEVLHYTTDNVK